MNTKLGELMADLMEEETIALVKELIRGTNPMDILDDARSAMEVVGKRFETSRSILSLTLSHGR